MTRGQRRSLAVDAGETLGLVGESGSGKSLTALAMMRLLGSTARIASGQVLLEGTDLPTLPDKRMRDVRGGRIGDGLPGADDRARPGLHRRRADRRDRAPAPAGWAARRRWQRAVELLDRVGIPAAERRARTTRTSFSGGMRQRVVIAMALACEPGAAHRRRADHRARRHRAGADPRPAARAAATSSAWRSLFVTHDLGVVADICDRVAVMYAGQVVETGAGRELFAAPAPPVHARPARGVPRPSGAARAARRSRAPCRRSTRCPTAAAFAPRCRAARPRRACRRRTDRAARTVRRRHALALRAASDDAWRRAAMTPAGGPTTCAKSFAARRAGLGRPTASCTPSTTCRFDRARARRSASSASPARGKSTTRAGCCSRLDAARRGEPVDLDGPTTCRAAARRAARAAPPDADRLPGPVLARSTRAGRRRHRRRAAARATACATGDARARARRELLDAGRAPRRRSPQRYPHELSGGQRQRIAHRAGAGARARS